MGTSINTSVMIREHKLLIDKQCPMCQVYGRAFVKTGLLDEDSICAYQETPLSSNIQVDFDRAKDEIALYDSKSGKTTYGLHTLVKIISHKYPFLNSMLNSNIIFKPLNLLYKFISSNRKVIAPSRPLAGDARVCEPSFSLANRIAYIVFVALVTAVIVNAYTSHLFPHFGWKSDIKTELMICFGQVLWQGMAISFIDNKNRMNYLGNMSTVSMIGGILLLPLLLVLSFSTPPLPVLLVLFFMVISVMFFEHIRRCKLLNISLWMTVSWVSFRTVALAILIFTKEFL